MKTLLTAALFFRMATHFNRGSGLSTIFIFCTAVYTHIWVQSMLSPQGEDTKLQGDPKLVYSKCQPFEAWINGRVVSESAYGINSAPNQTNRSNHCGGFLENKGACERAFFSKIQPKIFGLLENQFKIR